MKQHNIGKISSVSLYGSHRQEGHVSDIWLLISQLLAHGIKVSVEKKLADALTEEGFRLAIHGVKTCTRLPEDTQLAISVGGDGTFLHTARWLCGKEIPILGINTGHLGFLAENTTETINYVVELITRGEGHIEKRLVLQVECDTHPLPERPFALNEIAILKGAASMIDISVNVDGLYLASYRADGLLVSTPTGSTAYNLSVGGPILAPTLECIALSPIAPHTLTLRPVVVGANSNVEAVVTSRANDFRLSIDGKSVTIPCGTPLKIHKADYSVLTIRKPGENFASTLRNKLLWGH